MPHGQNYRHINMLPAPDLTSDWAYGTIQLPPKLERAEMLLLKAHCYQIISGFICIKMCSACSFMKDVFIRMECQPSSHLIR